MGSNPMLGVGLAMCGCFCSACGYTLQKLAHRRADAEAAAASVAGAPRPPYWRYWQFLAGMGMLIIGSVFAVVVFGLAGQAELAPMGAVTMIFNELLAWRVLRESFTRVDAISVLLMGLGTTIALAGAVKGNASYSIDGIVTLLLRPAGITYTLLTMVLVGILIVFISRMTPRAVASLTRGQAAADAFSRAFVGGMLGGFTGFLVKSIVEMVVSMTAASRWGDALRVEPYAFGAALALCLPNQVRFMNSGLARYDSNRIIPVYQCTLVFASALCGYVLWDEAAIATPASTSAFAIGCATAMAGMLALMWKEPVSAPVTMSRHSAESVQLNGCSQPSSTASSPKLRGMTSAGSGNDLSGVAMTLQLSSGDERVTLMRQQSDGADLRPLRLVSDCSSDTETVLPVVSVSPDVSLSTSITRRSGSPAGGNGAGPARKRQTSMSPDGRASFGRAGPPVPPPGMDRTAAAVAASASSHATAPTASSARSHTTDVQPANGAGGHTGTTSFPRSSSHRGSVIRASAQS